MFFINDNRPTKEEWFSDLFERLNHSEFRSKFKLNTKDSDYAREKGMDVIEKHAHEFIKKRLAPIKPENDGKQTPMRGHPVFVAQHATATCCRGCLEKWHKMKAGSKLSERQQDYIVEVIMMWIKKDLGINENEKKE